MFGDLSTSQPGEGGGPLAPLKGRRIQLLVATQAGNALLVAEALERRLRASGLDQVELVPEGETPDPSFAGVDVLLACIATHGDGGVPDAFEPVFDALRQDGASLSTLRYGVVALGDRTYKQFCGGGRSVDAMLAGRGARRVGEICCIDASSQPFADEVAEDWLKGWLVELAAAVPMGGD